MNLKNKWRHWRLDGASVAIIVGLDLLAYFGQIGPSIRHHEQAQAQTSELVTRQGELKELERKVHGLKEQLDTAKHAAASSQLTLQPAAALNDRLARLSEMATHHNLVVDAIESGQTTNLDRYSTVAIRISGHGSYRNCGTLLNQIRTTMPDVGVISVQMTSSTGRTDTSATFLFEMVWHTQPQAPAAKKTNP